LLQQTDHRRGLSRSPRECYRCSLFGYKPLEKYTGYTLGGGLFGDFKGNIATGYKELETKK
jgi:hypothetical protein